MPPAVLHSKLMDSELAKASIFFVEIEASFIFMDCVIVKPNNTSVNFTDFKN